MPRHIGTCFRFYTQMRVEKKPKHLHIEFIVTSHNSVHHSQNEISRYLGRYFCSCKVENSTIINNCRCLPDAQVLIFETVFPHPLHYPWVVCRPRCMCAKMNQHGEETWPNWIEKWLAPAISVIMGWNQICMSTLLYMVQWGDRGILVSKD